MADKRQQKYLEDLEFLGKGPQWDWKQLIVGICYTQLGDYQKAQHFYDMALKGFIKDRKWWYAINLPQRLVEAYVLAGQPTGAYDRVFKETEAFSLEPRRGQGPVARYACALVRLLANEDVDAGSYVPGIMTVPKLKVMFAIGKVIQTIIERSQSAFDESLNSLLIAHRGIAKFGELRTSHEGYLCLSAMCLSKMALDRGMVVNAESEYLSKGYLEYLRERPRL